MAQARFKSLIWRHLLLLFCALCQVDASAVSFLPVQNTQQPWRATSFLVDGNLSGCNVFDLDFENGTNAARRGTVWLATSDGLREYDGYAWTRYGKTNGLPSDFIRCVHVTRSGQLWVGTDRGAGLYDGKLFKTMGADTHLAGQGVRRIVEEPDGTLWFCSDPWPSAEQGGGITSYRDGVWRAYRAKDGLPSEYVVNFFADSAGRRWAVTKTGVAQLVGDRWITSLTPTLNMDQFGSGCLAEVRSIGLMFSSGFEVFIYKGGGWERQKQLEHHEHGITATSDSKIVASRAMENGQRCLVEWTTNGWSRISDDFEVPFGYNEDVKEGPDGNLWVVGFETVFCWRRNSQWKEFPGIAPPKFVDGSGRVWFIPTRRWSVRGTGALRPHSAPIRFDGASWERLDQVYEDFRLDASGAVWGWSSNMLTRWTGTNEAHFGETQTKLRSIEVGGLQGPGSFWLLGKDTAGVQQMSFYMGGSWSTKHIRELEGAERHPIAAEAVDGPWFALSRPDKTNFFALHILPSRTESVDIPRGINSQFRSGLFVGKGNPDLWLYGDNGLFRHREGGDGWEVITNLPGRAVFGIVERDRELWVACSGATGGHDGLARLLAGVWRTFSTETLLGMSLAPDGSLLLSCKGKLQIFSPSSGLEPEDIFVPEGFAVDSVQKLSPGTFWLGSEHSAWQFISDRISPQTTIFTENTKLLSGTKFSVTATAVERFRSAVRRDHFMFSWRIDGSGWSDFSGNEAKRFAGDEFSPGTHRIEVRARDSGGDVDQTPAVLDFQILPLPIQNRAWFLWAVFGFTSLLAVLGLTAVRSGRKLAGYTKTLEQRVAERTADLEADVTRRGRVEEALRGTEERLRSTLDNLLEGCQIIGFDWRYIYLNRVAAQQGRRSPDEYLGRTIMEAYPGIDKTPVFEALTKCMDQRVVVSLQNQFVYADGSTATFDLLIQPVAEGIFLHSVDVTARLVAEEAREKLARLVDHSGDFIAMADLKGQLTYLNLAGRRMIGFGDHADLALLNFTDYIPEQWKDFFIRAVIPQVLRTGLWEGEMQLRHIHSGALIDVSRSTFLIRDPVSTQPSCFATVTRDITARKKAEIALRESDDRFSKAFHSSAAIIAISTYPEGRYVDVNEAYTALLGYTRDEVIGRQAAAIGLWAVPEQRAAIISSLDRGESVRGVESLIRDKSGNLHTFLVSVDRIELGGNPCLLFVNYDITSRKKAELATIETQSRFKQLAENIREVFWLTDIEKSKMLYVSPGYEKIWGRSCDSLYQSPESWVQAIHPEDRSRIMSAAQLLQVTGEYDVEYRIVRPDQGIRWVHDRAFPVLDASGKVYCVAGIAEDVTDRLQLEFQLRQAQKMEALGTLSGGIAHDFNNLLSAIFGNVELARMDLSPEHPASQCVEEIQKAASRAESLVRQILTFSRPQPQSRQIISLEPVIQEVVQLLRATLPAGVELAKMIEPDAPNVLADSSQIHQVLLNLCTNSWHAFDGSNGRIEIRLSKVEIGKAQASSSPDLHEGSYACLSVEDTGQGMNDATVQRIFEPFFTTKAPGRGTGLGLSVVHGIVKSHDGAIRVTSKVGKGTAFLLYFPAFEAEAEPPAPTVEGIRRGIGQRILYVDDERSLVALGVKMISHLGYEVEGVSDSAEALRTFSRDPMRFDLVMTDLHMPGMSGLEFAEAILQIRPNLPIILSSGHLTDETVERAKALGIKHLLHKPNPLKATSESISTLLKARVDTLPVREDLPPPSR